MCVCKCLRNGEVREAARGRERCVQVKGGKREKGRKVKGVKQKEGK